MGCIGGAYLHPIGLRPTRRHGTIAKMNTVQRARDPFDLPIVDPTLTALYRHWLDARGGRALPARKAIDPLALRDTLPNLFLYTYDAKALAPGAGKPGRFYCRLAGEQINLMVGTVCSKRFLDQIFAPQVFRVVRERYTEIVTRPTVLHMHGVVKMANGLDVPGERLVLPLGDDGGLGPTGAGDALVGAAVYYLSRPGTPTTTWVGEDFVSIVEPGIPKIGWKLPG